MPSREVLLRAARPSFLEDKRLAGAQHGLTVVLCCPSPLQGVGALLRSVSTRLHYPSHKWGASYYSAFEMNPSLEAVSLQDAGDMAFPELQRTEQLHVSWSAGFKCQACTHFLHSPMWMLLSLTE